MKHYIWSWLNIARTIHLSSFFCSINRIRTRSVFSFHWRWHLLLDRSRRDYPRRYRFVFFLNDLHSSLILSCASNNTVKKEISNRVIFQANLIGKPNGERERKFLIQVTWTKNMWIWSSRVTSVLSPMCFLFVSFGLFLFKSESVLLLLLDCADSTMKKSFLCQW